MIFIANTKYMCIFAFDNRQLNHYGIETCFLKIDYLIDKLHHYGMQNRPYSSRAGAVFYIKNLLFT